MFSSSSKLFISTVPLSLFHHRPSTLLLRLPNRHSLISPLHLLAAVHNHHFLLPSPPNSRSPIKFSQQIHSQSSNTLPEINHASDETYLVPPSHPWPEFSELLESVSNSGYFELNRKMKDEFVPNESLPMEFVEAACSCLRFAHDRADILGWLSKDNIQVLINDGAPFLFKNALETKRRMKSFLQGEESNEATTVDLMKYILSYASNLIIYPERNVNVATESSSRDLLREIVDFIRGGARLRMFERHESNGEMRSPRQLTGHEWDCPECSFYNNGRNVTCLKCECKRPGTLTVSGTDPKSVSKGQNSQPPIPNVKNSSYTPFVPLPSNMFAKKSENTKTNNKKEEIITKNPEPKSKVLHKNSENSVIALESQNNNTSEEEKSEFQDFPEIMPMRKGENRFVVSKKKDRSLNSPKYKNHQVMEQESSTKFVPFVPFPPDYFAKKPKNDTIIAKETQINEDLLNSRTSIDDQTGNSTNTQMKRTEIGSKTSSIGRKTPEFETLSNGWEQKRTIETKNNTNSVQETRKQKETNKDFLNSRSSFNNQTNNLTNTQMKRSGSESESETLSGVAETPEFENLRNGWEGKKSLEGSAVKENDPLDMSEEAKAERWFRRVAQIKDISELSQIPDEDFPTIMPMRKGVNRFVVSKRKTPLERRLSSPEYRKNLRSESTKNGDDDR